MAVGRFTSAQALAVRLIAKNGEQSTHVRVVETASGSQPWRETASSETRTTVDAAWFEFDLERLNTDLIQVGDREVYVPATELGSVVPDATTDYMERIDGTRWQVIRNRTIQPNEDLILHVMQVRRA